MSIPCHAAVIKNIHSRAAIVEITDDDDNVIATIPVASEEQGRAVAEAYNYPQCNTNDWRERLLKGEL